MDKMESVIAYVYSADFITDNLPLHGPMKGREPVDLIDRLAPIRTMPQFISAPATCTAALALACIRDVMGRKEDRKDRARIMRGYLRAMRDDARERLRLNAEKAAGEERWGALHAGSTAAILVVGCLAFMRLCGILYRLRLPVGFSWITRITEKLLSGDARREDLAAEDDESTAA